MRKRLLCIAALSAAFLLAGCNTGGAPADNGIDVEYEDVPTPASYAAISSDISYTTYYFDSENGSDQNDGLTENSPKQTVDAANRNLRRLYGRSPHTDPI